VGDDQPRFVTDNGPEPDEAASLEELMARFRRTADGATARFASVEAAIIRDLVGQVVELIGGDTLDDGAGRPGGMAGGSEAQDAAAAPEGADPERREDGLPDDDGLIDAEDLAAMFGLSDNVDLPDDPVLARLLPDAYSDDPEASGEFRRYTEHGLRSGKAAAARTVLDTLPAGGGRVRLSEPEAQAWLRALNDVRLALGVRLEVTDDFDDQVSKMEPGDPRAPYIGLYQWLAFLQETLVRALS
jgi:hypothetical protein